MSFRCTALAMPRWTDPRFAGNNARTRHRAELEDLIHTVFSEFAYL